MPAPVPSSSRLPSRARGWLRAALPLAVRKRLAVWAGRSGNAAGEWWSAELVRDLAERDATAYHRFLWGNHLAYARSYEPAERFGAEHVHPSRRLLFADLRGVLAEREVEVRSVLEVGCSLGYLLRHLETDHFPGAEVLDGIDIDEYAVRRGAAVLRAAGSRVRLERGDAARLPALFGGRRYDLVLCAGVLMYLRQAEAAAAVRAMLARCTGIVALAGLAHPETDNARLERSVPRERDRSLVHNLDAMVRAAGGRVVARRWEGARQLQGNTLYFVFAEPADRREREEVEREDEGTGEVERQEPDLGAGPAVVDGVEREEEERAGRAAVEREAADPGEAGEGEVERPGDGVEHGGEGEGPGRADDGGRGA